MSFVHLHVHSTYSVLDGFSNLKDLTAQTKAMGMPAIALTDHGTMFGTIEFFNAARAAEVKPIIGLETYVSPRRMTDKDVRFDKRSFHLLLLAENMTGYQNLLEIASAAQLEGFYYYPRIDHEFLAAHHEGLIVSSACLSGEISRAILERDLKTAREKMDWYFEVLGRDHFFLELQQHNIPELQTVNKTLIEMGKRYNAQFIATNDVHYVRQADAELQDVLLAVQTGKLLSDPDRMRMSVDTFYLRSPEEMAALFVDMPEALSNTLMIAERCNVDLTSKGYHLPEFTVPPSYDAETYLHYLCEQGLASRFAERRNDEVVRKRLAYELGIIHKMGFDAYFLIVWDLCRFAREKGIWYNARGSAAGSLVAYALDITLVDPLQHDLLFERFLNPDRISMPDIDLDFQDDHRAEVMEYCCIKYGADKVAQIITFGTMGARAAIRDVGRVMDVERSEVDRIAKLVPAISGKAVNITEVLKDNVEFQQAYAETPAFKRMIDIAARMEGSVRNVGTHAAGVVISDKNLTEYVPLHRPTSQSEETPIKTVTQYEMAILDSLGMLKVDFLGLATLTVMARACQLIEERHAIKYTLADIPVDDDATFEFIGQGHTAGVFQLEGSGMTRYITQMKPQNLANIIAMVALYRPGPLEFIPSYIQRMHGEEKIEYQHELLEPILKETFGIPIYQEQIMFAAMQLAGYTASEADELRKVIAKKQQEKLVKHRNKFIKGAQKKGISEDKAGEIFTNWENFARYGFNKCLPGDTEIVDAATGLVLKIEDVYNQRVQLTQTITCDTDQLKLKHGAVAHVMDNGIKPVYSLNTALGRRIEATANHPFFTIEGWKKLDELKAGDLIATPRTLPVEGSLIWQDHAVIALGHLLAEGNLCHPHSVYFYSQSPEQADDFIKAAEAFDNVQCSTAMHKNTWSVYCKRIRRTEQPGIMAWAEGLGILGKNARQKEIPAPVFALSHRQISLLISRMWEGDGHIDVPGRSLFYATASERMARQLQHLLLRLGIISRLRQVTFPYKEGRTGYQLFITHHQNIRTFAEKIGVQFVSEARKKALETLLAVGSPHTGSKDVIPMQVKSLVRAARANSGITWKQMNAACGVAQREFYPQHTASKRGFTRDTINHLADFFHDPHLQRYAQSDIYWDEITSIDFVGEKQTYDLEVPGTHNFVANDILVHNSHAADYGVIAVQTAYLKAHYTAEYMTALLSASKNETDKVAEYVADCRSMGIEVLPPDVNISGFDFTIEDLPDGNTAIRFGMGAVKNVGLNPVQLIIDARKNTRFKDLSDFTRRVDLRQVGRRALESLIKVGGMDAFGTRPALLDGLDRLISVSSTHFKAVDAGQMMLFGGGNNSTETIVLNNNLPVDAREQLNWERDLLGLFVSDHPLKAYTEVLKKLATHTASQLADLQHEQKVVVAGMISRCRPHFTKNGKNMGFATLKDITGDVDLVIFPATWERYAELVEVENVLRVEGKLDLQNGDPKVLVDRMNLVKAEEAAQTSPAAGKPAHQTAPADIFDDFLPELPALDDDGMLFMPVDDDFINNPPPAMPLDDDFDSEALPATADLDVFGEDELPQDAAFINDDPYLAQPSAQATLEMVIPEDPEPPAQPIQAENPVAPASTAAAELPQTDVPQPAQTQKPAKIKEVQKTYHTLISLPEDMDLMKPDRPPCKLILTLQGCGDNQRDVLQMQRLYGMLVSLPGQDRFSFRVRENRRFYLLDFPNNSTCLNDRTIAELRGLLGMDNISVQML